jgi:prepilin-type processing-associated H-X9-DG protein
MRIRLRFPLWRLMVAIALIGTTMGVSIAVARTREAVVIAQCRDNLRLIGLAMQGYANTKNAFPAGSISNPRLPLEKRLSWVVALLVYLDQCGPSYDGTKAWDEDGAILEPEPSPNGEPCPPPQPVPFRKLGTFSFLTCPAPSACRTGCGPQAARYIGIAGVGRDAPSLPIGDRRAGVFGNDRRARLQDITDGLSNTVAVVESAEDHGPWLAGGRATVRGLDPARQPYLGKGRQFGGLHRGGAMALFADGSVRFLPESTHPRTLEALATIAGGERLPASFGD